MHSFDLFVCFGRVVRSLSLSVLSREGKNEGTMKKEKERRGTNAMSKLTDSSLEVAEADAWPTIKERTKEDRHNDDSISPAEKSFRICSLLATQHDVHMSFD